LYIFKDSHFFEKINYLISAGNSHFVYTKRRLPVNPLLIEKDFSAGRFIYSADDIEESGFPRTVGTNQSVDLSRQYIEAYIIDRDQAAKL
jgi:hypothetical protein